MSYTNGILNHDDSNHASNKVYVVNQLGTKADLSKTITQTFQGRIQVPDFDPGQHNGSDIVNLRYIDGIFLNKKTGGTLSNPISFLSSLPNNQKQIHSLGAPQFNSSATNKQYVDNKMTALKSEIRLQLSETLFWESYQLADCLYKIDRGSPSEVTFDNSTRAVSDLFDQSLKENDANQATQATKPILCTKAEKINYRYYLKFDGSKRMLSNINLNPGSGQADIVNVFIVYRLSSYTGSYAVRNGLFGHENGGYDKFIAFSPTGHLLVSGTTDQHIVIGSSSFNNKNATASYQSKANAGELNKWICLSIHWDVPGGNNASETWCNGKKLANFTARTSQGSTNMTFGDLNTSGIAGLKGDIAFYCLYKGKTLTESNIKLHHYVLCRWYAVDHDPISF